jgi:hypothetical protein
MSDLTENMYLCTIIAMSRDTQNELSVRWYNARIWGVICHILHIINTSVDLRFV